ncbi:mevalonate diphosphate decarboxylase [Legionella nautarum]|uniref:Mevalonate diphosphate decarboxylase n=1 Tax=Legionella nautarum TaxID=45070 RepID=A0A0W0WMS9_9GAMM|nr:diphosphomevalonate decarboxylase [Legionella nautarum]KTD33398.1 mevalonate diphosphate decarboxylase [Legionella nautarum]
MQWFAQAPANIALIKYMGKKDNTNNIPDNSSLSYTLNNLLTSVMLESQAGKKDFWEPLEIPGAPPFTLSTLAQERFLNHLARMKAYFNYSGSFVVRSSNNFPTSSGLASSASSFAALTKCAALALSELSSQPPLSIEKQAQLSMQGSGSSCRSFYFPWALWEENSVKAIELPYMQLQHQVIVISHDEKRVPSSEAHIRVKSSSHYETRSHRATENLKLLLRALKAKDWANAYHICWLEFQDMHHLFATSNPPFSYMTETANEALKSLQELWNREGDGPIVTMDAGPNIHLLYRPDQAELALRFKQDYLIGNYDVL